MGLRFSLLNLFNKKETRVLMLGLDNSGKTTILYALKLNELITTIPTIGFNVESVKYKNLLLKIWDIGGQDKIRHLWKHYYINTNALIYVIDSSDTERFYIAKEEFYNIINEPDLQNIHILICANKTDIINENKNVISYIVDFFELEKLPNKWLVQPTCAINRTGIYEGIEWLYEQLNI
jgi:small GTP-binding protein